MPLLLPSLLILFAVLNPVCGITPPGLNLPRTSVKVDSINDLYNTGAAVEHVEFGPMKAMGMEIGPLDAITVFDAGDHWHLVSTGLAERFGFELTFRLGKDSGCEFHFVFQVLQGLASYVFSTGNLLLSGDHINTNGPLNKDMPETKMRAVCFVCDGWVKDDSCELRQVVALTLDELDAGNSWQMDKFCDLVRQETSPFLVCNLKRNSVLEDPAMDAKVREGSIRDGSSTEELFVDNLEVRKNGFSFGDHGVQTFSRVLPARICHGKPLRMQWLNKFASIEAGEENSIRFESNESYEYVAITMTPETAKQIGSTLSNAKAGTYKWDTFDEFEVILRPDEITPAIDTEKLARQAKEIGAKLGKDN